MILDMTKHIKGLIDKKPKDKTSYYENKINWNIFHNLNIKALLGQGKPLIHISYNPHLSLTTVLRPFIKNLC
jgi:hypothetical protein